MNQITKKSLRSTIWLGSAGALLIVGGISALLASNWAYLPLSLQIIIAFAPLVCSWVGYLWLSYHKTASLAQEEILGIVWTGGVICTIALLGRVLQLSSTAFIFCITVAVLLLPVVFALRSTAAWVAEIGFTIAAALNLLESSNEEGQTLILLLTMCGLVYARLLFAWKEATPAKIGQRWLAAISTIPVTITVEIILFDSPSCSFLTIYIPWALPLLAGVFAEQKEPPARRPLMILGMIMFCTASLFVIATQNFWRPWDNVFFGLTAFILFCIFARKYFKNEGLFLFLLPLSIFAVIIDSPLVSLTLTLCLGAVVITTGVRIGQRMLANEGLLFTVITGFIMFVKTDMSLTLQGLFLALSGIAMVALNFIITRSEKKEVSHAE